MSLLVFVVDFYIDSYVTQKTDPVYAGKFGAFFALSAAIALSFVWNHPHVIKVVVMEKIRVVVEEEHALSSGVIISFFLYLLGKHVLLLPK